MKGKTMTSKTKKKIAKAKSKSKSNKVSTDDHIMVGEHRCKICGCKDYEHAWWEGWDEIVEDEVYAELAEAKEEIARRKPLKKTKKLWKTTVVVVTEFNPKKSGLENLGVSERLGEALVVDRLVESVGQESISRAFGKNAKIVRELFLDSDD